MSNAINSVGQPIGFPLPDWTPPEWPDPAPMVGRFCRLERMEASRHASRLFEANALDREGRMWTYLPYGPFPTLESYRSWMESCSSGSDPLFFAVVDANSGGAVGIASYLRIAPAAGCIEVGHVAFSPLLQRTPAATEAMFLMMERAFDQGYRRYEWKCDALNAPSRAAAQRFGFSFEGVFRQAIVYKGRNRDTAWYSILDTEWPALREVYRQWLAPSNFDADGRQRVRLSELTRPLLQDSREQPDSSRMTG